MNNDSVKTLLAFLGGAVAGAAIGILLAPDKGSETRKKIVNRAKDMGNDLTDAAMNKYDEFMDWKNSLMGDAEDAVAKAKSNMRKAEDTVKETVNEHLNKAGEKLKSSNV